MFIVAKRLDGWMKTSLGMEVDLGLGHIIFDGVPALRKRGTVGPYLFGPRLLWPPTVAHLSYTAELLLICL